MRCDSKCQTLSNVCSFFSVPDAKYSHTLDNSGTGILKEYDMGAHIADGVGV